MLPLLRTSLASSIATGVILQPCVQVRCVALNPDPWHKVALWGDKP